MDNQFFIYFHKSYYMRRKLVIICKLNYATKLNTILNYHDIRRNILDRNIDIDVRIDDDIKMYLYGYDGELTYKTGIISKDEFIKIFNIEMKQDGGNMDLYSSTDSNNILNGTGYKNERVALHTIKLISKRSIVYQKSVINTMYNRAKYHKNRTKDMDNAMKVYKKWLDVNKDKMIKYEYLDLDLVKQYEKLAEKYDISHVARGLKKPTKTEKGFLVMYKKYGKSKLPFMPVFKNRPDGMDYDSYREKFINSRMGQMKHANIKLYDDVTGLPTKQHVILIMHAYSPDPKGLKNKQIIYHRM